MAAVRRALTLFHDKSAWEALIRNNMALDFSWDRVMPQYLELYRGALEKRRSLNRNTDHDYEN
jgi:starch synthase